MPFLDENIQMCIFFPISSHYELAECYITMTKIERIECSIGKKCKGLKGTLEKGMETFS